MRCRYCGSSNLEILDTDFIRDGWDIEVKDRGVCLDCQRGFSINSFYSSDGNTSHNEIDELEEAGLYLLKLTKELEKRLDK